MRSRDMPEHRPGKWQGHRSTSWQSPGRYKGTEDSYPMPVHWNGSMCLKIWYATEWPFQNEENIKFWFFPPKIFRQNHIFIVYPRVFHHPVTQLPSYHNPPLILPTSCQVFPSSWRMILPAWPRCCDRNINAWPKKCPDTNGQKGMAQDGPPVNSVQWRYKWLNSMVFFMVYAGLCSNYNYSQWEFI